MKCEGTLLPMIAFALVLTATSATAQSYTPLYTYPETISNTTGVAAPALFSQGPDGELYSTIQSNGTYKSGSVYKMTTVGGYSLVYSFCAEGGHCLVTGTDPWGGVTLGIDGNLYGTTITGGAEGAGTVFKITPAGALTKLWDFTAGTTSQHLNDQGKPYYAPFQATDGNFYGVDEGVYSGTYGVFYKITTTGKLTAYPFNYTNGWAPNLPTQGTDGNFYGTAQAGGGAPCECGTVYKATAGGKITKLHTFTGYVSSTVFDGYEPIGALVQANDGDFWGTTYLGGAYNEGTIFKTSASGTYTLVYSFQYASPELLGAKPVAGLTLGSDGNLYGVTEVGGHNGYGTIFQVTTGGTVTFLHSFCSVTGCPDGILPQTPLVQHTSGKFYGTASGNSLCCGVFYSFDMGLPPFTRLPATQGKVGTTVQFLGQGFTGATSVSFNGTPATSFKIVSDTFLTAKVPVGALTGVVSILTSTGTLLSSHNFKVLPAVTGLSVTSGTVGTPVTISGSGLTQASKVTFGGVKAVFSVTNDSTIATTVPTGAKTGKVAVTTLGGTASSAATFTVTP
jgi:uncharacterized repeat protein (TIGR03803 family)